MKLLGLDLGTTHCKAGLFDRAANALAIATRPTPTRRSAEGWHFYDPEVLWQTAASAVSEVVEEASSPSIAAVGIASMAESGLLVDRREGTPRSHIVPWFDDAAAAQAERLAQRSDPLERFRRTGIRASFKCGLAKLLWLQERDGQVLDGAVWLSAADYIAFRLADRAATDYSLAGRTLAFRIDTLAWDDEWLRDLGLGPDLFPEALPSGAPIGTVTAEASRQTGLPAGIPVAVAGHDHLCAALAGGAIHPGQAFDSMGTAETLLGALDARVLGDSEYQSGLAFGRHVARDRCYWMGGLSASGGSVEWLRSIIADAPPPYEALIALLAESVEGPTGILYFPYLSGSGSPKPDAAVRGAFVGLSASHGRADLLKAVLEGTAYEMETIRRAGERLVGRGMDAIVLAGGGARIRPWLQIKADVSGCRLKVAAQPEAALLGAALIAGVGCGVYGDTAEAVAAASSPAAESILPDEGRHAAYRRLFEEGYMTLRDCLRADRSATEVVP